MTRFKKLRIKRTENEIEPHEIFWDSLAQKKEKKFGFSEKKMEIPFSKNTSIFLYAIFAITMLVFFAKSFQLQIIENEHLSIRASENRLRMYQIKPKRGVIYDSNFEQLVWNKPSFDLILDRKNFPKDEAKAQKILKTIAEIIDSISLEDLKEKIEKNETPIILIYENLNHSNLVALEVKIKNQNEFSGIKIEENTVRDYANGSVFAHIIGYTGKINKNELKNLKNYSFTDYIGKTGLEKSYEEILRGEPGEFQYEKNAQQEIIKKFVKKEPKTGKSLILWIDANFQKMIEGALKEQLKKIDGQKGAIIAMNPKNGAILALISWPNFDNNKFSQGISQKDYDEIQNNPANPLFNRIIAGQYLTGSTIKPIIGIAALEEKIISESTSLYCPLKLCVENIYSHEKECYGDWAFHGWTNIKKGIAESVNPFFYIIGGGYWAPKDLLLENPNLPKKFTGLGVVKIKEYLELFGWGKKTNIDIPGEKNGFIPDAEWKKEIIGNSWTLGNTYHLSIGQGYIQATPIQIANSFSAIANEGTLYNPQLVNKILDDEGNTITEIEPEIIRQNFIDPKNLQITKQGMRDAVIYGSSALLQDLPVKVASKTGTAQTPKKNYHHNWVTVFAPYDNPEIVLTVLIEDVEGLQSASLPLAKKILEYYFQAK